MNKKLILANPMFDPASLYPLYASYELSWVCGGVQGRVSLVLGPLADNIGVRIKAQLDGGNSQLGNNSQYMNKKLSFANPYGACTLSILPPSF